MPANATTDQYLASAKTNLGHKDCAPSGCLTQRVESEWAKALIATLPDVDPAVVGQVVLHVGSLLKGLTVGLLLSGHSPLKLSSEIGFSLRQVGADVYTKATQEQPASAPQAAPDLTPEA